MLMAYEDKIAEWKSRVSDPRPTLDDDGRGVPDEALATGFIHWLTLINARGDDGKQYFIEVVPMTGIAEAGVDIWMLEVGSEKGSIQQLPNSIYKVANYPFIQAERNTFPTGTLTMTRSEHEVVVELPDFRVICKDDHTWHYRVEDKKRNVTLEMVHYGVGLPTWYGKEKPINLTAHAVAYGYNWPGRIEGTLTIGGKKVKLNGAALRERYVAVDQDAAEIGGWEDWMWFYFENGAAFGSFFEYKFSKNKGLGINLDGGKEYYPAGDVSIEHHEWAFHPRLGAFVPTHYKIKLEVEAGVLELAGNIVESKLWGMRGGGGVPDAPLYTHNFDRLDGTFKYHDGRTITLSNGVGGGCVRLWKPYPNIFMPQFASEQATGYDSRVLLFE
jgi:hypothetical protein